MQHREYSSQENSRKAMVSSVEASLRRLKTERIDLFYAHVDDSVTPMEEIVRGFDDLVRAGKILYAGLSNFPAWRVARAATLAELRAAVPIAAIQIEHSLVQRVAEQELIPASQALGIAVVAYSPMGGGVLTGKYRTDTSEKRRNEAWAGAGFQPENTSQRSNIIDTLIAISKEIGVTPGEIAIAWVSAKGSLPIIGPRTLTQLETNLRAATISLTPHEIERLDSVSATARSYPYTVIDDPRIRDIVTGGCHARIDTPASPVA